MARQTKPTPKPRALSDLRKVVSRGVAKMTEAKQLALLERRYQVWELRKQGYSIRDIAGAVQVTEETVRNDIIVLAKRLSTELSETVEEARSLQITRLDALLKKYQPAAELGSLSAASMVLQIEARRSKLLALDTPETKKLDVSGIREYVGINLDEV